MSLSPFDLDRLIADAGLRANNYSLVESLRSALGSGEHAYKMVPTLIEEVLDEGAWLARTDPNGAPFDFSPGEFLAFIEAPTPKGLGTTADEVAQYLGGSDNPVRLRFHAEIGRKPGGLQHEDRDPSGKFIHNPNIVRIVDEALPDTAPPPRDRSREPQAGNSIGYTIRRFEREARQDEAIAAIYAELKAGRLSANAAAVAAGFRPKAITIPAVPAMAGRLLARHFTREQFSALVDAALDAYGVPRDVNPA